MKEIYFALLLMSFLESYVFSRIAIPLENFLLGNKNSTLPKNDNGIANNIRLKSIAYDSSSFMLPNKISKMNILPSNLTAITYINGIYHSEEDWTRITHQLSQLFGEEVRPFYNPSSGWWVTDISKAGFHLVGKSKQIYLAKELATHFRSILASLAPQGRILHLAHSGGAILTYLAAKYHLSSVERSRIDVVTFGGGHSLTKKYFPGHLVNYYAQNDPCLVVDPRASKLIKKVTFNGISMIEKRELKHNTSYVFVEALTNNPLFDHSMEGPTYRIALLREAQDYQRRLRQICVLHAKDFTHSRLIRKKFAALTNQHHFFQRLRDKGLRIHNKFRIKAQSNQHQFAQQLHRFHDKLHRLYDYLRHVISYENYRVFYKWNQWMMLWLHRYRWPSKLPSLVLMQEWQVKINDVINWLKFRYKWPTRFI